MENTAGGITTALSNTLQIGDLASKQKVEALIKEYKSAHEAILNLAITKGSESKDTIADIADALTTKSRKLYFNYKEKFGLIRATNDVGVVIHLLKADTEKFIDEVKKMYFSGEGE